MGLPAERPKTKARILVVDDDGDILSLLQEYLEIGGFEVILAPHAFSALKILDTERVDAIISDLMMPGLDGLSFLAKVRHHPLNKSARLFILSGAIHRFESAEERIASLGIAKVFQKPIDGNELVSELQRLIPKVKIGQDYDPQIVKACVAAVRTVIEFYFMEKPTIGRPFLKTNSNAFGYASAVIPVLQGPDTHGSISLSCDRSFLSILQRASGSDAKVELSQELIMDVIGELCQQISTKLKEMLSLIHYKVEISLPEVILGDYHLMRHRCQNAPIAIPVQAKGCEFQIEFCMNGVLTKSEGNHASSDANIEDGILVFPD